MVFTFLGSPPIRPCLCFSISVMTRGAMKCEICILANIAVIFNARKTAFRWGIKLKRVGGNAHSCVWGYEDMYEVGSRWGISYWRGTEAQNSWDLLRGPSHCRAHPRLNSPFGLCKVVAMAPGPKWPTAAQPLHCWSRDSNPQIHN